MNEELEVYIEAYKKLKKNREIINSIDSDFFFDFANTILNYIENSIPKKVIEEKIEESKKEYKKIHAQHYRDCGILENRIQAKILAYQELLEVE